MTRELLLAPGAGEPAPIVVAGFEPDDPDAIQLTGSEGHEERELGVFRFKFQVRGGGFPRRRRGAEVLGRDGMRVRVRARGGRGCSYSYSYSGRWGCEERSGMVDDVEYEYRPSG